MRVLTLGIVLALLSGASAQAEERKTAPSYIPPVLEEEEEVKRPTPEDLAIPLNAPAPAPVLPPAPPGVKLLTKEQAEPLALKASPGFLAGSNSRVYDGTLVYEVDIELENGSLVEVEVHGITGQILNTKSKRLGPEETMERPALTLAKAENIAKAHLEAKITGLRRVEVLNYEYTIVNKRNVYVFELRRGIRIMEIILDANTGSVVSSRVVG